MKLHAIIAVVGLAFTVQAFHLQPITRAHTKNAKVLPASLLQEDAIQPETNIAQKDTKKEKNTFALNSELENAIKGKYLRIDLRDLLGLTNVNYKTNLSKQELFHEALQNDKGRIVKGGGYDETKAYATALGASGPLIFYTDPDCTGRRVKDTFAAAYPEIQDKVWWKSDFNQYDPVQYEALLERMVDYLNEKQSTLYVQDLCVGRDPSFAVPFRFVGEYATHALFARTMFPKTVDIDSPNDKRWTMLNVPSFHLKPDRDGSRSDAAIIVDFKRRIALVAGPADYCGTVKKTMFTIMNFMLPDMGYLPMHSSANVGKEGDAAILFGLSGTGKTTLSADPDRKLIGDDEIAWTDTSVSNLEDGCYAKLIDLDKKAEPVIAAALSMPTTVIENVPPPEDGRPLSQTDPQELDLQDRSITENTRFAYGLECNPVVMEGAQGGHPETVILLTADAFGVMPPIAMLDSDEVMYHFASGYSSKLAGTEVGIKEPKATFSACFGAPFMSRFASVYANLLAKKIEKFNTRCVLLNTGWSGGPYGEGKRMPLRITRALLNAALDGSLDKVDMEAHPVFRLRMPKSCPGVPSEILNPRKTWADKSAYDEAALKLRDMFRDNFDEKGFKDLGIKEVM